MAKKYVSMVEKRWLVFILTVTVIASEFVSRFTLDWLAKIAAETWWVWKIVGYVLYPVMVLLIVGLVLMFAALTIGRWFKFKF